MFNFHFKKYKKIKAQGIVEGALVFIFVFLFFIFIAEFAIYFQSLHANQTLSDDINANIVSYDTQNSGENFCSNPDIDTLDIIQNRARKYLDKNISLQIAKQSEDILVLKSEERNILTINILCPDSQEYIVRSEYVFKGFFVFHSGHMISSISSVQTPKF